MLLIISNPAASEHTQLHNHVGDLPEEATGATRVEAR